MVGQFLNRGAPSVKNTTFIQHTSPLESVARLRITFCMYICMYCSVARVPCNTLYCLLLYTNVFLLWVLAHFSLAPVVFSRSLGCGARRGADCIPRRMFGSRAGSVALALDTQSREIWQEIARSLSAEKKLSKILENPHVSCVALLL